MADFIITDTRFINVWDGRVVYAGSIVNTRPDGQDAGYITIIYTEQWDEDAIGKYYVIHYKNLTAATVDIAGALKSGDPDFDGAGGGKTTQAEAESAYTVANGYFGDYSSCHKMLEP